MTLIRLPPADLSSIASSVTQPIPSASGRYIAASPYLDQDHLLDLETLDRENQILAQALTKFVATRHDYATAPYRESFNWSEVITELKAIAKEQDYEWRESFFYVIAFRSRIPPTTVYADLEVLDKAAHLEAVESGGLLKYARYSPFSHDPVAPAANCVSDRYWFGLPDKDGRNLATCLWRSQADSKLGGVGPAHRKASGATRHLYTEWQIERYRLSISHGIGSWEILDWTD